MIAFLERMPYIIIRNAHNLIYLELYFRKHVTIFKSMIFKKFLPYLKIYLFLLYSLNLYNNFLSGKFSFDNFFTSNLSNIEPSFVSVSERNFDRFFPEAWNFKFVWINGDVVCMYRSSRTSFRINFDPTLAQGNGLPLLSVLRGRMFSKHRSRKMSCHNIFAIFILFFFLFASMDL